MAGDTKDRICGAALRLFNERGYDQVSLRDVAREAGIAIGSLTYHFSKKDDLLAKMLADLHAGFEGKLDRQSRGVDRLAGLLDLFAAACENQQAYPFYFRNIDAIVRDSEAMRAESIAFERTLCGYYAESLRTLADDDVISLGHASPEALACAMVALHASWASPASPAANGATGFIGVDEVMAATLAAMVAPEHAEAFHVLCAERGIPTATSR